MEYLIEVEWTDPVASALGQILYALPDDIEQRTGVVPAGRNRGFVVLAACDRAALDSVADAVTAAGAAVRVTARREP